MIRISTSQRLCEGQCLSELGLPLDRTRELLLLAKEFNLNVIGVSFHVEAVRENPSRYDTAMIEAIENSRQVFRQADEVGFRMTCLNLGGGFLDSSFEETASKLTEALDIHFPVNSNDSSMNCTIIAEPGQFFVSSVVGIACQIIGKRPNRDQSLNDYEESLYLNDSVYSTFMPIIHKSAVPCPTVLKKRGRSSEVEESKNSDSKRYRICGLTGYTLDVVKYCKLQEGLSVGDWLYFPQMGGKSIWSTLFRVC